ncbi:MAG: hypothetical protein JJU29_11265 [Verrucomicrobia bacterium]|nr:hypothetical protein [Verrucomicrobiota bacterium]MCH8512837.1 hypothetical protein [Kiritimatiellia bacterium]
MERGRGAWGEHRTLKLATDNPQHTPHSALRTPHSALEIPSSKKHKNEFCVFGMSNKCKSFFSNDLHPKNAKTKNVFFRKNRGVAPICRTGDLWYDVGVILETFASIRSTGWGMNSKGTRT